MEPTSSFHPSIGLFLGSFSVDSMPGTSPEITTPASAPGQTAPLSAKTTPVDPTSTVNPVVITSSRRESIAHRFPTSISNHLNRVDHSLHPDLIKSELDPSTVALRQFVNDDRHFSLIRNLRLADLITILNGVCGSLSIFSSCSFLLTLDLKYLQRACLFPVLSLGFDFMDGKVARFRNESSVLGQELDSLADLISFGIAPALIGFAIGLRHPFDVALLTLFVCAGLTRLARFNSTASFHQHHSSHLLNSKSQAFEGFPIPTSLWLVAIMYESVRRAAIELPLMNQIILDQLLTQVDQPNVIWLRQIQKNGNRLTGGLIENSWGFKAHWMSLAFGTWAFLMLSKSLRVPKI
ncbi:hypothetical protein O181_006103 [Austropuccinia psidii MF-1]|uniref:CDP-diacylglycerol--serine O-phosphatidyltransferase n=1 Tax=Austropuccinia psidii MF-1 TaxID=1389203 RepID=A0A9Q3GG82_9BASI|nr:hypothetical protein [Austropuccinia psidii MF-1]